MPEFGVQLDVFLALAHPGVVVLEINGQQGRPPGASRIIVHPNQRFLVPQATMEKEMRERRKLIDHPTEGDEGEEYDAAEL